MLTSAYRTFLRTAPKAPRRRSSGSTVSAARSWRYGGRMPRATRPLRLTIPMNWPRSGGQPSRFWQIRSTGSPPRSPPTWKPPPAPGDRPPRFDGLQPEGGRTEALKRRSCRGWAAISALPSRLNFRAYAECGATWHHTNSRTQESSRSKLWVWRGFWGGVGLASKRPRCSRSSQGRSGNRSPGRTT